MTTKEKQEAIEELVETKTYYDAASLGECLSEIEPDAEIVVGTSLMTYMNVYRVTLPGGKTVFKAKLY